MAHNVVDIEVHFGTLLLSLEEVLVAEVAFNVLPHGLRQREGGELTSIRLGSACSAGRRI